MYIFKEFIAYPKYFTIFNTINFTFVYIAVDFLWLKKVNHRKIDKGKFELNQSMWCLQ